MNKASADTITKSARFLRTPTAQQAREYLKPCLQTALKVLDGFADGKPKTYEELAEITGLSPATCRQVITALDKGGYGFTVSPSQGYQIAPEGGRPPVQAQPRRISKQ